MVVAEIPCRKVLDDKEKKERKTEEKIAAKAPAINIQAEATVNKAAGWEGPQAFANEEHVSPPLSVGRMDTLQDQTDEHVTPPRVVYASKVVIDKGGQGNVDASHAIEGHGDNEDGLSGLQIRPSPAHPFGRRLDTLEEPAPKNIVLDAKARTFPLPINGDSRIQVAWTTHHADLAYAHESCKDVKVRYKECKKELVAIQLAYDEKVSTFDQHFKNYDGGPNLREMSFMLLKLVE
ncbi:hypothetical protein Tco_1232512, partial [Tanacetum coccineum]